LRLHAALGFVGKAHTSPKRKPGNCVVFAAGWRFGLVKLLENGFSDKAQVINGAQ
jgi:hypothetical protein